MLGMNLNRSPSEVDRWLEEPMTQLYLEHLNRHAEFYKKELISGQTLQDAGLALIKTARTVGALEALESKQKLIFFDMKRELEDDNKRVSSE